MSRMFPHYYALITAMPGEDPTDEFGNPRQDLIRKGRCYATAVNQEMVGTDNVKVFAKNKFYIEPKNRSQFEPAPCGRLIRITEYEANNPQFLPSETHGEGRIVETRIDEAISSRRITIRVMTT